MKRLLIDVNSVVPFLSAGAQSGIGRTTMELLQAMAKVPGLPFEVMLYSQNLRGVGGRQLNLPFRNCHLYLRHTALWNQLVERLSLRELATGYDLMHIPHNYELVRHPDRCVVTLHDALFMKAVGPTREQLRMQALVPPFVRRCRHIVTCSESSKSDIVETMHVPEDKVTVVYWGLNHQLFRPMESKSEVRQRLKRRLGLTRAFFFSLSCNAKRKRADVLVKAYIDYCEHRPCPYDLVLIWENPPSDLMLLIQKSRAAQGIHFIKSVTDDELALLYNGASALFFPSAYEGFGLPVIEAMACGTPVVTCKNSSLGEIAGDAAIYLDEPVEDSIPKVMDGLVKGLFPLDVLAEKGLRRAAAFSWSRCAHQFIDVYKSCLDV